MSIDLEEADFKAQGERKHCCQNTVNHQAFCG